MEEEFDEVVSEFLVESYENLDRLDQDLLALEENPGELSILGSAFRTIHTIKGTCGFLGYSKLERVTHVGENLLSRLRDGALVLDAEITTALLEMVDAVRAMLAAIETSGTDGEDGYEALAATLGALTEPRTTTSAEPVSSPVGDLLVASGATGVDAVALALAEQDLGDGRPIGQILVGHGAVDPVDVDRAVLAQLSEPAAAPSTAPDGRVSLSDSTIRVDVGVLDQLMNLVGELVLSRNNILQNVGLTSGTSMVSASQQLDLVTGELQECVMKTRMQPIGTVWSKFTRVVRDLSVQCGKQVRIELEGEETELDKTILEAIKDPLTHVVRNTVDHGIELPAERVAAGKSPEGALRMRARHEGGQVVIEISDDGAGINADRVKAKAVSRGLVSESQALAMSERDAVALIFAPGFSTAETVTNVSGRGVGMDVVKTNIERIGGTVDVESELGVGTTLRIRIPLTLAIIPALLVECAGHRFAIPQVEVLELVRLDGAQAESAVEMLHSAPVYRLRGNLLPLVHLRAELGLDETPDDAALTIAVVASDDRVWGLVVDRVLTTEEIVVKPLGRELRSGPAFSGATIMGDGQVALILDIPAIAKQSNVVAAAEAAHSDGLGHSDPNQQSTVTLLIVSRGDEQFAIDMAQVDRLERFDATMLERSGDLDVVQYRGGILPLISLGANLIGAPLTVVVFDRAGHLVGLVVEKIVDIIDTVIANGAVGPAGTLLARDRVTQLLDVDSVLASATNWLDRNHMEVVRAADAPDASPTTDVDLSPTRGLCTFWLAGLCFGIDVLDVQEVRRHQDVTVVPLAPAVVAGLINLRGQIITSCDLRLRLDLGERSPGQHPKNIVVRTLDGPVSLLVDEIGDVIDVGLESFEVPPSTVSALAQDLIVGAYKLEGRLLLELDIHRVIRGLVGADS